MSENPDISKLKSVEFTLINPLSATTDAAAAAAAAAGEGLSTRLETVVDVELLDVPTKHF